MGRGGAWRSFFSSADRCPDARETFRSSACSGGSAKRGRRDVLGCPMGHKPAAMLPRHGRGARRAWMEKSAL